MSRAHASSPAGQVIHAGKGYQSSVYLAEVDGQKAAVKDFSQTPPVFRLFVAPWLIRREVAALRHLRGTPGVPRFLKRLGRYSFALEFVEGTPLDRYGPGEIPDEVFPRVQAVIDAIHARHVAHGDLKRRSNLLLTAAGEIYLIDFAAATIGGRRFGWIKNWLQREMAQVDDKSVPRLKKFVAPGLLTDEDHRKLSTPTRLERAARRLLNR
jgi:predicted Ser/Thr protein kinase